jgi:hypothetical protein
MKITENHDHNIQCILTVPVTPTVELNTLAMRRGEIAVYTFLDQKAIQNGSLYAAKLAHKRLVLGIGHARARMGLGFGLGPWA